MRKVIVTGANGFLGTALCQELSNHNLQIIAVVRNPDEGIKKITYLRGIKIVYCDMKDYENLPELIKDRDIDTFYHLAWQGSAGFLRGDEAVQINNIKHTCEAVRVSKELGCRRFVFASSIMEYEIQAIMSTESVPNINTLYCTAKVAADYMTRTIAGNIGIEYIRAVISNIYGPGELSPRLISTSLQKMLKGEHCSFSSGTQMYDFVYISDAASIFYEIGEKGKANKTYYIGSLEPKPLKDFLYVMRDCVDPNLSIGLGELQYNGVSLSYKEFDITAVKTDTGFSPKVDFKSGINKTIEWLRGIT